MSEPAASPRGTVVSGKLAVLALFALGGIAVAVAMTFHYRSQARPLALWGPQAAQLLLSAPQVELWTIVPTDVNTGQEIVGALEVFDDVYDVLDKRDISQARGLVNVRQGLINDRTFDWKAQAPHLKREWEYALLFRDGQAEAVLLFDFHFQRVALLESLEEASIAPVADGLQQFIVEQLNAPAPAAPQTP